MPKTLKSGTRKLLCTMIEKFKDVQSDINQKYTEKIRQLDSINSLLGSIENEDTKFKVTEIVDSLKTLEKDKMLTSKSRYLEEISAMTEISVETLRRIKKEGSINQGQYRYRVKY